MRQINWKRWAFKVLEAAIVYAAILTVLTLVFLEVPVHWFLNRRDREG
jgi:hypothetical protein